MLFNVTSVIEEASQVRENMTHIDHVKTACGVVCACGLFSIYIYKTDLIYTE